MTTVTATKARGNLYALIDEANASHEPIQITGKRGNAVLISEDDWRSIRRPFTSNPFLAWSNPSKKPGMKV